MDLKLSLEYDGAPFVGWQVQAQGTSLENQALRSSGAGNLVGLRMADQVKLGADADFFRSQREARWPR